MHKNFENFENFEIFIKLHKNAGGYHACTVDIFEYYTCSSSCNSGETSLAICIFGLTGLSQHRKMKNLRRKAHFDEKRFTSKVIKKYSENGYCLGRHILHLHQVPFRKARKIRVARQGVWGARRVCCCLPHSWWGMREAGTAYTARTPHSLSCHTDFSCFSERHLVWV